MPFQHTTKCYISFSLMRRYICFSRWSIRSIVDSRLSWVKTFSATCSNLSMRAAEASSQTMTRRSPNYPVRRLLVWKNTLILNSSVRPGTQIEKKHGARFFKRFWCSVMKFISKLTSAGYTIVRYDDLNSATTVVSASNRPKKNDSATGLFL